MVVVVVVVIKGRFRLARFRFRPAGITLSEYFSRPIDEGSAVDIGMSSPFNCMQVFVFVAVKNSWVQVIHRLMRYAYARSCNFENVRCNHHSTS